MTARDCLLEPPWDCWTSTALPLFCRQYLLNAALKSWYSSRVGSYETLSSVRSAAEAEPASPARATAAARFLMKAFMIPFPRLETDLRTKEESVLGLAVGASRRAALEGRVVVV